LLHRHSWFPPFILPILSLRLNSFLSLPDSFLDEFPARLTLLIEFLLNYHKRSIDEGASEQLRLEQAEQVQNSLFSSLRGRIQRKKRELRGQLEVREGFRSCFGLLQFTLVDGDAEGLFEGVLAVLAVDALVVEELGVGFELEHALEDVVLGNFVGSDEGQEVGFVGERAPVQAQLVEQARLHFLALLLLE